MPSPTFDAVVGVLHRQFDIDRSTVQPGSTLHSLGLDSLALMEFVFAVEDHFGLRLPEERLDPRQQQLTVADLCRCIEAELPPATRQPPAAVAATV